MQNAGQVCIATKRVFVHKDIVEEFTKEMVEYTKTMKVGDGMEPGISIGPINNSMQYERVKGFYEDVKKAKQNVILGGQIIEGAGYFAEPTIVLNPADDSRIMIEEPFGMFTRPLSFNLPTHSDT